MLFKHLYCPGCGGVFGNTLM
ncbi:hypothetical protein LINPERHAP1_LOCUS19844 [Linum perenne]